MIFIYITQLNKLILYQFVIMAIYFVEKYTKYMNKEILLLKKTSP